MHLNIATRTMMSLPEIHACCIQASLELDPLRTAYSVMTGAEEGGFGKPNEVHSILMMNALNYHGKIIFGLEPINLKYLMALIRFLYTIKKISALQKIESKYSGLNYELELAEFIDKSELIDTSLRMGAITNMEIIADDLTTISKLEKLEKAIYTKLFSLKVLIETINYCLAQLAVLSNMKAGYLQGVGFAHEGLADGMINKMFRVLYSQINKYSSHQEFTENVYQYFSAHGNYIDVYNGLCDFSEGVEVTHAQRELEKLMQLDKQALNVAWLGANDFANRNVLIWDGMLKIIENQKSILNHN